MLVIAEVNNSGSNTDEHEETDESEFEEENEEGSEVDEDFVNNLKTALGSAAAHTDGNSDMVLKFLKVLVEAKLGEDN